MIQQSSLVKKFLVLSMLTCSLSGWAQGLGRASGGDVARTASPPQAAGLGQSGTVAPAGPNAQGGLVLPRILSTPTNRMSQPSSRASSPEQQVSPNKESLTDEAVLLSEFQEMVALSLGRGLPMFGYNLFHGVPSTFAPVENVPVTPDYTVGPGDELLIRAWGQIDIDYRAVVDRNGTISIPGVGVINVSGIKYQELTNYVKNAVSRNFRNFELEVSMGQLRSIQVLVVGQARRPGSYTVSSLSTLVNAIFAAGGPSVRGSMRSIQLKRGNQTVAEIDLYDLLVSGDKSRDGQLLPGDVIYFPPIGPLAALSGSVNSPAIFELKGDTSMEQLVQWAGGLATTARIGMVSLERVRNRMDRFVEQFALDAAGLKKPIHDGDIVSVFPIRPRFEGVVSLRGNVAVPLRYPYRSGMRVRDLIPEREALITDDYYLRRNLEVRADIQAQPKLRAELRRQSEINWDYAAIERLDPIDLSTRLIPFNLGKAVLEGDPANNLILQPGDVVTIFSKEDMQVPLERQTKFVLLEGEFAQAGIFEVQPGETLRQLVARVGGLSSNAYLFGSEFTRVSTREQQQRALDEAINRLEADIQRGGAARAQNAISGEDVSSAAQQLEAQRALLAKLRQVRATGRIVMALAEQAGPKDLPDLRLENGDRFYVPAQPSTVQVIGSVFSPNALVYRSGKRLQDYLAEAGGPTRDADRASIYLLRADGSVVSARQSGYVFGNLDGRTLMPGDSIVVPEDFEKTSLMRSLKDIAQIFYQFGLGAAAIKVLRN